MILTRSTSLLGCGKPRDYSGRGARTLSQDLDRAILSVCCCLSNDDISNSIRAIAAINPPSTTGGSLLGLAGNSSGAAAGTAGSPAAAALAAVVLRYCLDHLRNDESADAQFIGEVVRRDPPVWQPLHGGDLEASHRPSSGFTLGIS